MSALILFLMMSLGTACPQEVRTGEILNVVTAGDGPAVVLLPGLSGCAYGYRQILVPLQAAGLRTVIIEPLGYGGSSRPRQADYSLTAQADRIAAVLDSLQLKDCLVVGHGLAASMALRLAYRRADLVAGIVSIEGAGAESAATPGVTGALKLGGLVAKLGAAGSCATSTPPAWPRLRATPPGSTDGLWAAISATSTGTCPPSSPRSRPWPRPRNPKHCTPTWDASAVRSG